MSSESAALKIDPPRRTRRRRRAVRSLTINVGREPKRVLALYRPALDLPERPKTRGECANGARPCPFVSCKHHLYLDVTKKGSIQINFPDLEPDEMTQTCSLDVADEGGATQDNVGALMNISHGRIQQIEKPAIAKMPKTKEGRLLSEYASAQGKGRPVYQGRGMLAEPPDDEPAEIVEVEDWSPVDGFPLKTGWKRIADTLNNAYEKRIYQRGLEKRPTRETPPEEGAA